MARAFIVTPVLLILGVLAASAQGNVDELRTRLESRFEIVPIANGVVLTPRFKTSIRSIEVSDSTIAIDGVPATGRELRERLASDADLVLQVSYLDTSARRSLASGKAASPTADRAGDSHNRSCSRRAANAAHSTRAPPRRYRSHWRQRHCGQR